MTLRSIAWWAGPELTSPQQREDLLREAQPNIDFQVINEGIVGTTSAAIVYLSGDWLERHDPHIVIAMMGINDEGRSPCIGATAVAERRRLLGDRG